MKGRHRLKANEVIGSSRLAMSSPIAAKGESRGPYNRRPGSGDPKLDRQPVAVEDGPRPVWVDREIAAVRAVEQRLGIRPTLERIEPEPLGEPEPGCEEVAP